MFPKEFINLIYLQYDMVSYKKLLIFLSMLFVFAVFFSSAEAVNSEDILFNTRTLNGSARPGESLEYLLFFTNLGEEEISLSLNTLFPGSHEISPRRFTIEPNERQVIEVIVNLRETERPRNINIRVTFFNDTDGSTLGNINLEGKILEFEEPFERASINYVEVTPSIIDPREDANVEFEVTNPIENITVPVEVSSDIEGFETYRTEMEILEGTNKYNIEGLRVPRYTLTGEYSLSVNVIFSELTTIEGESSIEISGFYYCDAEEEEHVSIFGKEYYATVKNTGTQTTECFVSKPITSVERHLIRESTEDYVFEDGQIVWELSLEPGEEKTIELYISFIPLLIIPFIVLGGLVAVWYFTRKVWVKKELVDYKRHAGFMDLKIQLRVKNLTNENMEDVKLYDILPSFIKEVRDYGTVPGKVKKKGSAKVVEWEIDNLKPKEERVFSYKVRTSIEVLGNINFPPAEFEFSDEKGEHKEKSNVLTIAVK